ncbi:NAD-dependent epimerase/dehydratase family protein [Ottowia testudinis]|uniref:NAD-dependent epimerase/dehydratase family protein n=1 Tax=Ottowia testudinis TaxID=2816950 RepID=A0A975CF25_9BURK|nr:NAD-dependent epimerase/dehydratase family protein [Ottowia testudinis]QTD45040.1 NAD-dependent epimerase/dehydratase family protein [Ottowia testudinis]
MRCVILGGAGFLGRHIGQALAQARHEVWSVDRSPALPEASVPWLVGQVKAEYHDVASWWRRCSGADVLIHLASSTVPATANVAPLADVQHNLMGTLQLLQGLREMDVRPRLLFASSGGAVYGRPQTVPIDEDHPKLPMGAYGVTKLAIEHHLRIEEAQHALPYRIIRLSNPYGEWQRPQGVQGVIAVFAHRALHGEALDVWGDGSVVRDFVHAADVGRAFCAAATHQGDGRVFNVGAGKGISVNEIIVSLERLLERCIERRVLPGRLFDPPVNVLDIARARAELNWEPALSFEVGLERTLRWMRTLP